MFALVLLSVNMDSLDYIWSRNDQEKNRFDTENWINLQFLLHYLLHLVQMILALAI